MSGRKLTEATVVVVVPMLLVACAAGILARSLVVGSGTSQRSGQVQELKHAVRGPLPPWINGVDLPSFRQLSTFTRLTRVRPRLVGIYIGLTQHYPDAEIRTIAADGAIPLIQLNPRHVSLAALAAGKENGLLLRLRAAIIAADVPVWLSFAHEANGSWYTWGCGHVPASTYIRAWRRVWQVIGTRHVTWVWTVNQEWRTSRCPLLARWPGSRFVNWIGVDGYLRHRGDTFDSVFLRTIRELRPLGKPIILTEAGVSAGAGQPTGIRSLYAEARRAGCRGILYFDGVTRKGAYWPQASPAALRAFRQAASA